MKDRFSAQSHNYAKYRPTYPDAVFEYLKSFIPCDKNAWDCGTGNGQVAIKLSRFFTNVYATDISKQQLESAVTAPNIHYSIQPAESTNFDDDFFDLVTVAQAIHWFRFDQFYAEVKRTAKHNSLIAVLGYGRFNVSKQIDELIDGFYFNIIGSYWDKERRYIDEDYQTIPFPFQEISTQKFNNRYQWTLDHLIGYLNTWSAVKNYKQQNGSNPVDLIFNDLKKQWSNNEKHTIHFPLLFRLGRILK